MRMLCIVVEISLLMMLSGCVSAERAEYSAWQSSDDGIANVTLETFESKYQQGWRERAEQKRQLRLAKEAKEREIARQKAAADELRRNRDGRIAEIAPAELKVIRARYAKGEKYICPYRNKKSDWLKTWTNSRFDLTEEDKLAGGALLAEFCARYLPSAYANYEKVKDEAVELQQVFNEEFPNSWTIEKEDSKWSAFNKILEKLAKVRTAAFISHDELCHYWLAWRFGVMTEAELAEADAQPLAVALLPECKSTVELSYEILKVKPMEAKISDFAAKYAPESAAVYQKLEYEYKELSDILSEVCSKSWQMDYARFDRVLTAAVDKSIEIAHQMNMLVQEFETLYTDHRVMEKTSDDVAKYDHVMALQLKSFIESLPSYIKERACGRVIPASDMITIPGRNYRMQRTEVTQLQWMVVMGYNPSWHEMSSHPFSHVRPRRPVGDVSWDDCQEFIRRVSIMDGVKYRLPRKSEWEYACRAGSTGEVGKRKNGEEGPISVMGWLNIGPIERSHVVARMIRNERSHDVDLKGPNAWGLYDKHGNVGEWCAESYKSFSSYRLRLVSPKD